MQLRLLVWNGSQKFTHQIKCTLKKPSSFCSLGPLSVHKKTSLSWLFLQVAWHLAAGNKHLSGTFFRLYCSAMEVLLHSLWEYYLISNEGKGRSVQSCIVQTMNKNAEARLFKTSFCLLIYHCSQIFRSGHTINTYFKWTHFLWGRKNTGKQWPIKKDWTLFQVQDVASIFPCYLCGASSHNINSLINGR